VHHGLLEYAPGLEAGRRWRRPSNEGRSVMIVRPVKPQAARGLLVIALGVSVWGVALPVSGQRSEPKVAGEIDGDPIYAVLEADAIPAIRDPELVTGAAAAAQMKPDEPVIGVVVDGEAHAYSTWQLDAHEIVNDRIAGTAIAASW
jgi:hypothetical protein